MPDPACTPLIATNPHYTVVYDAKGMMYITKIIGGRATFVPMYSFRDPVVQLVAEDLFIAILTGGENPQIYTSDLFTTDGVVRYSGNFERRSIPGNPKIKVLRSYPHGIYIQIESGKWFFSEHTAALGFVRPEPEPSIGGVSAPETVLRHFYGSFVYRKRMELLLTDQRLLVNGRADAQKLGVDSSTPHNSWYTVPLPSSVTVSNIKNILFTLGCVMLLTENGEMYGIGVNNKGALGLGGETNLKIFTRLAADKGQILQAATGSNHTVIVTEQGVFGTGDNYYSQIGSGGSVSVFTPINSFGENFADIRLAAANNHTIIYNSSYGDLHFITLGDNKYGQLGSSEQGENHRRPMWHFFTNGAVVNPPNFTPLISEIIKFQIECREFYTNFLIKHKPMVSAHDECEKLIKSCTELIKKSNSFPEHRSYYLNAMLSLLSFIWMTIQLNGFKEKGNFDTSRMLDNSLTLEIFGNPLGLLKENTELTELESFQCLQYVFFAKYEYYTTILTEFLGAPVILPSLRPQADWKRSQLIQCTAKKPIVLSALPFIGIDAVEKTSLPLLDSSSTAHGRKMILTDLTEDLIRCILSYLDMDALINLKVASRHIAAMAQAEWQSRMPSVINSPAINPSEKSYAKIANSLLREIALLLQPEQRSALEILRHAIFANRVSVICLNDILSVLRQAHYNGRCLQSLPSIDFISFPSIEPA